MKNLNKLSIIFLALFIIFSSKSTAADRILPSPKPLVDQETKTKTADKKIVYPKKKPKVKKEIDTSTEVSKKVEKSTEEDFIYPEKKPIVVKKKIDKAVVKSTLLSKSDFKIAKAAIQAVDKKNGKLL